MVSKKTLNSMDTAQTKAQKKNDVSTTETRKKTIPPTTVLQRRLNLAAYIGNISVTYLVGTSDWLGLPDNATLSRKYQTLVTPVGWAFAIWGVIFTSQLVWVVMHQQFLFGGANQLSGRRAINSTSALDAAVGYKYVGVGLAQMAWSVTFANELLSLSLVCMITILIFLWNIDRSLSEMTITTGTNLKLQYWIHRFPFAIHTGWICAATAVNINVVLVAYHVPSNIEYMAAVCSLLILLAIAFMKSMQACDYTIPAVLAYALLGIYYELRDTTDENLLSRFDANDLETLQWSTLIGSILIVTFMIVMSK